MISIFTFIKVLAATFVFALISFNWMYPDRQSRRR